MRKPTFCICENKGADQLRGNHATDQRLCFCYIDSLIPLLPNLQASNNLLWLYSPFCGGPESGTPKTGFLVMGLI